MIHPFDRPLLGIFYFLALTLFFGVDLWADMTDGESLLHLVLEGSMALLSLIGLVALLKELASRRLASRSLRADLASAWADAVRWRAEAQELMRGLGVAIDGQFAAWELTPAERDVGLMLLKGLTYKEIADARATSERTVRQQGREVYRKAGVSGRAELSAWFLEDLLLPADGSGSAPGEGAAPGAAPPRGAAA